MDPLTLSAVSAVFGFIMKSISASRIERHKEHMRALERVKALDASHDAAAAREPGKIVRRFLVVSLVLFIFGAAIWAASQGIDISYISTEKTGGWFWGLFGPETDQIVVTHIQGLLMHEKFFDVLAAITGFYFGQGAAK